MSERAVRPIAQRGERLRARVTPELDGSRKRERGRGRVTPEQIQVELAETAKQSFVPVLAELFADSKMFDSFDRFRSAGFALIEHAENKIMSGSHKRLRGYLIKKYNNAKSGKKQIRNYMRRIEGARLLRTFIAEHGFTGVVTPQKWLYELPRAFPERYCVIAEKLDLLSKKDTESAYDDLDREQGRELATILYYFRGLNSTAANLPFTKDNKIAFIDTERWHRDKDFLRKVGDRLPGDRRKEAEVLFKELSRQGARPFVSAFR
jgi:hypothetical protein